jgi:hypothetical protein
MRWNRRRTTWEAVMHEKLSVDAVNNYNLKSIHVELTPGQTTGRSASLTLADLEAMRSGRPVSASKFGMEVICGASCDTGAQ